MSLPEIAQGDYLVAQRDVTSMSWRGYVFMLALVISIVLFFQILLTPGKSPLLDWWHSAWKWP